MFPALIGLVRCGDSLFPPPPQNGVRSRLRRALFAWRTVDGGAQLEASFSLLERERASAALSARRHAELVREVDTLRANNAALLSDITNYRALEAQHEQLLASTAAGERVEAALSSVKEQANAKLAAVREAADAAAARMADGFRTQIADLQVRVSPCERVRVAKGS